MHLTKVAVNLPSSTVDVDDIRSETARHHAAPTECVRYVLKLQRMLYRRRADGAKLLAQESCGYMKEVVLP